MTAYPEPKIAEPAVPRVAPVPLQDSQNWLAAAQPLVKDMPDRQKLAKAFEFFNQMSQQLSDAYSGLEQQVRDLTAELSRMQARHEEEVAKKEMVTHRLEGLLNILPVGVVVLDVRGRVQQCNLAAIELLGEPLLGESWLDIIQRSFAPRLDDGHEVSLRDGRRVSLSTRSLDAQRGQLVVLTDMTQTRALQERLSQHQRLSALGQMVASLAHQIRTPLSAAMLYGEHLANPELPQEQQLRFAGKLNARLAHLEQQVRDMLIFAKGDLPLADRIATQALVAGVESAAEAALLASDSELRVENNAPQVLLQCNAAALIGALVNLINNAIQAVTKQAQVTLRLEVVDECLHLHLIDQGPGIDPSIRARVFEPFVTTKSQGTGLGLAVVQAVARAHHGEFSVQASSSAGTHLLLTLPVYPGEGVSNRGDQS